MHSSSALAYKNQFKMVEYEFNSHKKGNLHPKINGIYMFSWMPTTLPVVYFNQNAAN